MDAPVKTMLMTPPFSPMYATSVCDFCGLKGPHGSRLNYVLRNLLRLYRDVKASSLYS
jgi:hypothetical protein